VQFQKVAKATTDSTTVLSQNRTIVICDFYDAATIPVILQTFASLFRFPAI
jgi:hypothetical protein